MTVADYLAWEVTQTDRHEFFEGEIFAMSGAEDRHVTVCGNAYIALRQHLSASPCRTCMSDMRLHVSTAGSYFYPDVIVTCSAVDQASAMIKSEPKLIVEVLSPSTAAYDRSVNGASVKAAYPLGFVGHHQGLLALRVLRGDTCWAFAGVAALRLNAAQCHHESAPGVAPVGAQRHQLHQVKSADDLACCTNRNSTAQVYADQGVVHRKRLGTAP